VVRSATAAPPVYVVGCPDVLEVRFADRPHLDCLVSVDLDGRLPISETINPHVEGGTLDAAHHAIAAAAECVPDRVTVTLADARTGRVYLFGPERNRQRVVQHLGAERLLDFLYRTGSLRRGCSDLGDVFVLRPNVAVGGEPEVFRADVRAVLRPGVRRRDPPQQLRPPSARLDAARLPAAGGGLFARPAAVS
jgi:polysaccharide export outer membrane protein